MLMDLAASGGYYVAVAGDRIVAHPTTVTGSIGVIALHVSLAGLLEKIGVRVETLKSGPLKDMVSPFRGLGDEERRVLQQLIDQMHERFVAVVAEGRRGLLTEAEVRRVADGRILSASQAMEARLVDRVGYLEQALEEARGMARIRAARVVMYSRDPQAAENVYSQPRAHAEPAFGSLEWARGFLGVRLYYLWEPYLLGR
jgi:protease-4